MDWNALEVPTDATAVDIDRLVEAHPSAGAAVDVGKLESAKVAAVNYAATTAQAYDSRSSAVVLVLLEDRSKVLEALASVVEVDSHSCFRGCHAVRALDAAEAHHDTRLAVAQKVERKGAWADHGPCGAAEAEDGIHLLEYH